jgi:hypothetical protein
LPAGFFLWENRLRAFTACTVPEPQTGDQNPLTAGGVGRLKTVEIGGICRVIGESICGGPSPFDFSSGSPARVGEGGKVVEKLSRGPAAGFLMINQPFTESFAVRISKKPPPSSSFIVSITAF